MQGMAIQKKSTPVAKPVAGKKSTAMVPWAQRFAGFAKAAVEQVKGIGGVGQSIKFGAGGTITVAGGTVPGNRLNVIILASCFENAWYGGEPYDADDPQPPICYAFGELQEGMAPHEECQAAQSADCAGCEKNAFGSAAVGRGKACGNKKRLALLLAKDIEGADDVASAELAIAKISPTNLKTLAGYVRALAEDTGRPPFGVVTEISGYPDQKNQYRLEFKMEELIEDEGILDALEARLVKAQEFLQQPYGPPIERPKKAAPRSGGNKKFAAQGKKK
jgi:hypothetical protein